MKVYITTRLGHGPSILVQEETQEHAVLWKPQWPYSDIKIGDTKIFINPSETKTAGYELTSEK